MLLELNQNPWLSILSNEKSNNLENKITKAVGKYQEDYQKYFKRNHKYNLQANMLDPYPRLIVVKGMGIFSTGPSFKDAKIAMDVGLNSLSVILESAKFGEFRSIPEKEIFKMEYWPLELAKIKPSTQRLKGHVTVITGGLGAIGYATAQKFLKEGSEVVLLDIVDPNKVSLDLTGMTYFQCDITNENKVEAVYDNISQKFGGVDILISNAGFAIQSSLNDLTKKTIR
jgi:hypothetical protein